MHLPEPIFRPIPFMYKVALSVLIVAFLLIGLIGLIMPIIPGILFLALAALLMTRVSRRAATFVHRQPWFHRHMGQLNASRHLSVVDRLTYGCLIAARGTISALKRLLRYLTKAR